jgi:hypothetical protein
MKVSDEAVRAAMIQDSEDTKRWLREKRGYTAAEARNLVGDALRVDLSPDYRNLLQAAYDAQFGRNKP